jgi:hypothetical protein
VLAQQLAGAIASAPLCRLDDLSRDVWRAWAARLLDDDGAQRLNPACGRGWASLGTAGRLVGHFYSHQGDESGFV